MERNPSSTFWKYSEIIGTIRDWFQRPSPSQERPAISEEWQTTAEEIEVINGLNQFPAEVLINIFAHFCIQPYTESERDAYGTVPHFLLGRICRSWRKIAWGASELWANLETKISWRHYDMQLKLVEEWLQRSNDRPLSVVIRFSPDMGSATSLISLLVERCHRWTILELRWNTVHEIETKVIDILGKASGNTPLLERVLIDSIKSHQIGFLQPGASPALRELFWRGHLRGLSARDLVFILKRCPNVEECRVSSFTTHSDFQPSSDDGEFASFPSIRLLEIQEFGDISMLRYIRAPSLRHLSIAQGPTSLRHHPDLYPLDCLITFSRVSGFKLDYFGLSVREEIDIQCLKCLLSCIGTVTSVYLETYGAVDYDTWQRVIPNILNPSKVLPSETALLPDIQTLQYFTDMPERAMQPMADMVRQRWNMSQSTFPPKCAKLKTLRLNKKSKRALSSLLTRECEEGFELTYDLQYQGHPYVGFNAAEMPL
ncbi:hypothetical protein NLJ89_g9711 [Agrocybe chaxingu]|uniref:F-box domain-containing protein n=1 Tax=Agrocybe chaxingu TaxID=84603 RepID=A0A9W8K018_9AGAR|nr:hypothetical protein NLJ89_g9711 [Agrocybe chaxingu]